MFIDRETIKKNMTKVLQYSQEESTKVNPEVMDMYMRLWELGKADFIKAFGGTRLVFPEKIQVHQSEEVRARETSNCLNSIFVYVDPEFDRDYSRFISLISSTFFYQNCVPNDFKLHATGKVISKGTKIGKALKYFISDPGRLRRAQDYYSERIQKDKISGYFVLSVDPLDYLSLSENTYKWKSCLNLQGEYRGGTLGYMTDYSTVVAYLTTNEPTKLPHFPNDVPWNSKKLRFLLHFNTDLTAVAMSKIYPYDSEELAEIAWEKIRRTFPSTNYWEYPTWKEDGEDAFNEEITLWADSDFRGYNDIDRCNTHGLYRFNHKKIYIHDICVGEATYCLSCGNRVYDSETMYCLDCGDSVLCEFCEDKYPKDQCNFIDGNWVCPDCFSELFRTCYVCDRTVHINDFNSEFGMCDDCAERYEYCDCCGELCEINDMTDGLCQYCYEKEREEEEEKAYAR